jgi:hypothetical protein
MKRSYIAVIVAFLMMSYGVSASLVMFTDEDAYLLAAGPSVYTEDFSTAPLGTILSGETPTLGTLGFSYFGSPDDGNGDPFEGQPLVTDFGKIY